METMFHRLRQIDEALTQKSPPSHDGKPWPAGGTKTYKGSTMKQLADVGEIAGRNRREAWVVVTSLINAAGLSWARDHQRLRSAGVARFEADDQVIYVVRVLDLSALMDDIG
jgi:hypothetical protein